MDQLAPVDEVFPAEPILQAVRAGKSVAVQLAPGQSLSPADIASALDISTVRFLAAGKPHDLVSFADQISSGAAADGKAGRDEAFKVLTTVDAKTKTIVLVITGANTLSSEATLQFLANAMSIQRRLCLVLIGQGTLDSIVMSPLLAPVRKRFVLLSAQHAPEPAEGADLPAAPVPAGLQVTQTQPGPVETGGKLPVIPIAAGAGALAVLGAAFLLWPRSSPAPQAPVQTPTAQAAPKPASSIAVAPPPKPAAVALVAPPRAVPAAVAPPPLPKPTPPPLPQPDMVKVPAGVFKMGSLLDRSEAPVHTVSVAPFAISAQAVTVQMWSACVQAGACKAAGQGAPNTPVTNVSWDDANLFANWLSSASGVHYRLPTEAEWEYAARAGSAARYAWGDKMVDGRAGCADCGPGHLSQAPSVTAFPANGFGLYGMGGGVEEWVQDCWHKNYDGAPAAAAKAWDTPGCSVRVLRGGSWENKAVDIRTASRDSYDASVRYPTHGFRLVRPDAAVIAKPISGKS